MLHKKKRKKMDQLKGDSDVKGGNAPKKKRKNMEL